MIQAFETTGPKVLIKIFFVSWISDCLTVCDFCIIVIIYKLSNSSNNVLRCNVSNGASPHQPSIKCILISNMHRLVVMEKIDTFYDFKIWLKTKEYGISYTQNAHIIITLKLYKSKCHIFINTLFHPNKIDIDFDGMLRVTIH